MSSASLRSSRFSNLANAGTLRQVVAGLGVAAPLTVLAVVGGDEPSDVLVAWILLVSGLFVGSSRRSARLSGWLLLLTGWTWLAGGVLHRGPLAHLLLTWPNRRAG